MRMLVVRSGGGGVRWDGVSGWVKRALYLLGIILVLTLPVSNFKLALGAVVFDIA